MECWDTLEQSTTITAIGLKVYYKNSKIKLCAPRFFNKSVGIINMLCNVLTQHGT